MPVVLAVATILGGIAAIWFFRDKIAGWWQHGHVPDPPPEIGDVDLDYPDRSGLKARLEAEGYKIRWSREDNLAERFAEGWEIVIESLANGTRRRLRIREQGSSLHLIRKRAA